MGVEVSYYSSGSNGTVLYTYLLIYLKKQPEDVGKSTSPMDPIHLKASWNSSMFMKHNYGTQLISWHRKKRPELPSSFQGVEMAVAVVSAMLLGPIALYASFGILASLQWLAGGKGLITNCKNKMGVPGWCSRAVHFMYYVIVFIYAHIFQLRTWFLAPPFLLFPLIER